MTAVFSAAMECVKQERAAALVQQTAAAAEARSAAVENVLILHAALIPSARTQTCAL
jgi:hypothetical protein